MTSDSRRVLVTGGAGYIGSHAVLALRDAGWHPVVLDNLTTGFAEAVPSDVPFILGDVRDGDLVRRVLTGHGIGQVIHFAGSVIVGESLTDPVKYYSNNTTGTLSVAGACATVGVTRLIFSSTAAVYGIPAVEMVDEDVPAQPITPYGQSKRLAEIMLADIARAVDLRVVALRYFNVAGAHPQMLAGQRTANSTHLIKLACEVALGRRPCLDIYGTDYATPDGTGIRDYIHVQDLVGAHVDALSYLERGGEGCTLNCGYGHGYSVREVAAAVERATGRPLAVVEAPRRAGDVGAIVADARRLRAALGWRPQYDRLDAIIEHTLAWHGRHLGIPGDQT